MFARHCIRKSHSTRGVLRGPWTGVYGPLPSLPMPVLEFAVCVPWEIYLSGIYPQVHHFVGRNLFLMARIRSWCWFICCWQRWLGHSDVLDGRTLQFAHPHIRTTYSTSCEISNFIILCITLRLVLYSGIDLFIATDLSIGPDSLSKLSDTDTSMTPSVMFITV